MISQNYNGQKIKKTLITSSKEKIIKFWSLPKEWRDKKLEAEEER